MNIGTEFETAEAKANYRKSMVRPNVTYFIVIFYVIFTPSWGYW